MQFGVRRQGLLALPHGRASDTSFSILSFQFSLLLMQLIVRNQVVVGEQLAAQDVCFHLLD